MDPLSKPASLIHSEQQIAADPKSIGQYALVFSMKKQKGLKIRWSAPADLAGSVIKIGVRTGPAPQSSEKLDQGWGLCVGLQHNTTTLINKISKIMRSLGFFFVRSSEIETERNNFTALNVPADHPSRSLKDTFYLNIFGSDGNPLLLRTHMSSSQPYSFGTRVMPLKVFSVGKVFRRDDDTDHLPVFHQLDGLWLDAGLSLSHLKTLCLALLNQMLPHSNFLARFRTSHFPFTEPSVEVDVCSTMSQCWTEVLGGGLVHPKVLCNAGVSTPNCGGLAFGVGIERLIMLKHNLADIHSVNHHTSRSYSS